MKSFHTSFNLFQFSFILLQIKLMRTENDKMCQCSGETKNPMEAFKYISRLKKSKNNILKFKTQARVNLAQKNQRNQTSLKHQVI